MPRPTLNAGEIWEASLANSAGYPILDGTDEYGHGPKVIDDWLDDQPDQIKAQFYGWYGRLEISDGGGRTIAYSAASVMLVDGTIVQINSGTITIAANALRFVYVSESGTVSNAATLPPLGIPLGLVQTNASAITDLIDLRSQKIDQVRPLAQSDSAGFQIGDMKETSRQSIEPGWALCNYAIYNAVDYPLAWDAIGRINSQPNDPPNTFRVPPPGRVYIGAGAGAGLTARTAGQSGGAESVGLSEANNGRHSHPVQIADHTHSASSNHAHTTSGGDHVHSVLAGAEDIRELGSLIRTRSALAGQRNGGFSYVADNRPGGQPLILPASVNVAVNPASANVAINPAATPGTASASGNGAPHENMPPYFVVNKIIRIS